MKKYHIEFDLEVMKGNPHEWVMQVLHKTMLLGEQKSNFTCTLVNETNNDQEEFDFSK